MSITEVMINSVTNFLEAQTTPIAKLILLTTLIAIYAIFIFYFYRFLAKKNLIELNLNQYNKYSAGTTFKIIALAFYILEYLILLPIITFFWFTVLSMLILLLAEGLALEIVLLISAALVASVRVTSFISESLSQDLAKMLPLTLLGVALTNPRFFEFVSHIGRIAEIPLLFNDILYYLVFIIITELAMRLIDLIVHIRKEGEALKTPDEEAS